MNKEHDCVVLMQDLTSAGLKAGDVGTVVHVHQGGACYEVEFMTLAGESITVVTLLPSQIRAISGAILPTCANWRAPDLFLSQ
jgi:hypothetical protein